MTPWRPQPRAMDDDPRLLVCTPAAQALAFRLASRAVEGAVLVGRDALSAVVAICGGAQWAVVGLDELFERGLVERDGEALVLAWAWPVLGARESVAPASAAPSSNPERLAALAKLRAHFSKRSLVTCEARLAWLEGDDGRRILSAIGLTLEDARPVAESAGRKGGRFGVDRPARPTVVAVTTDGCNHGGNPTTVTAVTTVVTGSPSPAPLSPKNKDQTALLSAREDGGNHGGNPTVVTGSPMRPTGGGLADLLVASASGGIVRPDPLTLAELESVLIEGALTPDEARAWGADLGTQQGRKVSWPWLKDPHAVLLGSWLRGHDPARGELPWRRVREGLATWRHHYAKRECARAKQPPPAAPATPAAPVLSADERRAVMRARTTSPFPPQETPDHA